MNDHANEMDEPLNEQLSAFMDGELPPDQARFLLQRLRHDTALRERWERMQLASACLRGQAVRLTGDDMAARIAAAVAQPSPRKRTSGAGGWRDFGLAAAVALAVLLLPRWGSEQGTRELVAAGGASVTTSDRHELPPIEMLIAGGNEVRVSPAQSISEMPVLISDQPKPWPKSPLLGGAAVTASGLQVGHSANRPIEQNQAPTQDRSDR